MGCNFNFTDKSRYMLFIKDGQANKKSHPNTNNNNTTATTRDKEHHMQHKPAIFDHGLVIY
jgi:hypothetical protein